MAKERVAGESHGDTAGVLVAVLPANPLERGRATNEYHDRETRREPPPKE